MPACAKAAAADSMTPDLGERVAYESAMALSETYARPPWRVRRSTARSTDRHAAARLHHVASLIRKDVSLPRDRQPCRCARAGAQARFQTRARQHSHDDRPRPSYAGRACRSRRSTQSAWPAQRPRHRRQIFCAQAEAQLAGRATGTLQAEKGFGGGVSGARARDRTHAVERSGAGPANATWTVSAIVPIAAVGCARQDDMQVDWSTALQHLPSGLKLVAVTQSGSRLAGDTGGASPPTSSTAISKAMNLRRAIECAGRIPAPSQLRALSVRKV